MANAGAGVRAAMDFAAAVASAVEDGTQCRQSGAGSDPGAGVAGSAQRSPVRHGRCVGGGRSGCADLPAGVQWFDYLGRPLLPPPAPPSLSNAVTGAALKEFNRRQNTLARCLVQI